MNSYFKLGKIVVDKNLHKSQQLTIRLFSCSVCCSSKDNKSKEVSKKYSKTLFLPKTTFPVRIEGKKRTERDAEIFKHFDFEGQYQWQRENRKPGKPQLMINFVDN